MDSDIPCDIGVEPGFESHDLVLGLHASFCSRGQNVEQWVAFLGIGDEGFRSGHDVRETGHEDALARARHESWHYYGLRHSVKEEIASGLFSTENCTKLISFRLEERKRGKCSSISHRGFGLMRI